MNCNRRVWLCMDMVTHALKISTCTMYMYKHTLSCVCVCVCRQFLSLTRALLQLAEQMHYFDVMSLLATPLKHCPEVLFISIIESTVSCTNWLLNH